MLEADGGGQATQAAYEVWGAGVLGGAQVGAAVASGGGGFEFGSVEEMNQILGMWKDRHVSILDKRNKIEAVRSHLLMLADDTESQGYLQQARESVDLLYDQYQSMVGYVDNYIQKLTDAINAKRTGEEHAVETLASARPENDTK